MASATSTKAPCATCGIKSVGIFKCEGCAQIFCRNHVNEHRDMLNHQLDEIVIEYDTLQQIITERKNDGNYSHSFFKQIDQWERDSIVKIQQTADEARQQVEKLTRSQKEFVSKELQNLAEQLQKARTDDNYVESDLHIWTTMLEKLKNDVANVSSLITIREDPAKILVTKIFISSIIQQHSNNERFGESNGNVRIDENGLVAVHGGLIRGYGFVRGINEYSSGKHTIRFVVNKKNIEWIILFGIISKLSMIPQSERDMEKSVYGWYSDDAKVLHDLGLPAVSKDSRDLQGETKYEIELLLDCDNQKISYFNQRTRNTREINVDLTICPFPWQLLFYLYDTGDQFRLLPS